MFGFQKVLALISEKLKLEWISEVMYSNLPHKAKVPSRLLIVIQLLLEAGSTRIFNCILRNSSE